MDKATKVCPKCQSGSVSVSATRMNRKTGKPIGKGRLIWAYILIGVGAIWATMPLMMMGSKIGVDASIIPLLIFAGLVIFFGIQMLRGYNRSPQIREGECLNCRHRWSEWTENVGVKTAGQFCPQCGKEEVFSSVYKVNRDTMKPISPFWGWVGLPLGILIAVGAIWMAINIWQEGDDGIIRWQFGSTIAGLGFLAMGYWGASTLIGLGLLYFRSVLKRDYRCAACGHNWSVWADGTPITAPRTILDAVEEKKPPEPPEIEPS